MHVTVYVVVAVSAPVPNEPDVPVPPPPDELHEVLLVDVQEMVVLALYAIEDESAEIDTLGAVELPVGGGVVPGLPGAGVLLKLATDPPPHAASVRLNNIIAGIPLPKLSDFMIFFLT
jgi:hypothetical protein